MAIQAQPVDDNETDEHLRPTAFIDSDTPAVAEFAARAAGADGPDLERAVRLYYAVRDDIRYDPYRIETTPEGFRAGRCLDVGYGFCITKAALLAACARAVGIPARLGYGDVRNHLATEKLLAIMGTDLFVFHGYTDLLLEGRWVKATPAFNLGLCQRFGVKPLEFDGRTDSLFHEFDAAGRRHMEYVNQHGAFTDLPFDKIMATWRECYPRAMKFGFQPPDGDFAREAEAEHLQSQRA